MSTRTKTARGPKRRHVGGSSTKPKRPWSERQGVLLTEEEAAEYLGVTKRFVERTRLAGELQVTYVGRLVRYHIEDVEAYIARQRSKSNGAGS